MLWYPWTVVWVVQLLGHGPVLTGLAVTWGRVRKGSCGSSFQRRQPISYEEWRKFIAILLNRMCRNSCRKFEMRVLIETHIGTNIWPHCINHWSPSSSVGRAFGCNCLTSIPKGHLFEPGLGDSTFIFAFALFFDPSQVRYFLITLPIIDLFIFLLLLCWIVALSLSHWKLLWTPWLPNNPNICREPTACMIVSA